MTEASVRFTILMWVWALWSLVAVYLDIYASPPQHTLTLVVVISMHSLCALLSGAVAIARTINFIKQRKERK